jgi:hypothetical protein
MVWPEKVHSTFYEFVCVCVCVCFVFACVLPRVPFGDFIFNACNFFSTQIKCRVQCSSNPTGHQRNGCTQGVQGLLVQRPALQGLQQPLAHGQGTIQPARGRQGIRGG